MDTWNEAEGEPRTNKTKTALLTQSDFNLREAPSIPRWQREVRDRGDVERGEFRSCS